MQMREKAKEPAMPELLTDLIETSRQWLTDYDRTAEIIPAVIVVLLIILLFALIRRRRKKAGQKNRAMQSAELQRDVDLFEKPDLRTQGPEFGAAPEAGHEPEPQRRTVPESGVAAAKPAGLMDRLKTGLGKTRKSLTQRLENAVSEKGEIDPEALEDIEEALITADVGLETTTALIRKIKENASEISNTENLRTFLKQEIAKVFRPTETPKQSEKKPHVVMVIGVNGVGKTTSIGKLAHRYRQEGLSVIVGASDTFRAAAVEQLEVWAQRAGAQIVSHRENADPAAVAYDAVEAAISRGIDRVIIDTAGRLHTKTNLMEQLKKIKRSIAKKIPDAPHEVLLVLDATTGQNAVSQAKMFHEGIGVTGLVLTKLDGTAKGGIVVAICSTMKLPISYIGVGESVEDLQPFDPNRFVDALF